MVVSEGDGHVCCVHSAEVVLGQVAGGGSLCERVGTLGGDGRSVLGMTTLGGNGALDMSCVRIVVCDLVCRDRVMGEFKI
jgi:hypothetical protein